MQFRSWHIDGFGIFNNHQIPSLGSGLNVFLGPNEAGKSTTLAFLKTMLFGLPRRSRSGERHEPLRGGRHGGRVDVQTSDGVYTIERWLHGRSQVMVHGPDGRYGDETFLRQLLGQADDQLYASIYAFGLAELTQASTLAPDAVRERLYNAGLQGTGPSASEAIKRLRDQSDALCKKQGGGRIKDLYQQQGKVQQSLREAMLRIQGLVTLQEKEAQLLQAVRRLADELDKLSEERADLDTLLQAHETYYDWDSAQRAIARLPQRVNVGPDAAARLAQLETTVAACRTQLQSAQLDKERLEADRAKWVPDPVPLARRAAQHALEEQKALYEENTRNLLVLTTQLQAQRQRWLAGLGELGADWTQARVQAFDGSIPRLEMIRAFEPRLREAQEAARQERVNGDAALKQADAIAQDLAAVTETVEKTRVDASAAALREAEAALAHLRSLLTQLGQERATLAGEEAGVRTLTAAIALATRPRDGRWLWGMVALAVLAAGGGWWWGLWWMMLAAVVFAVILFTLAWRFTRPQSGNESAEQTLAQARQSVTERQQRIGSLVQQIQPHLVRFDCEPWPDDAALEAQHLRLAVAQRALETHERHKEAQVTKQADLVRATQVHEAAQEKLAQAQQALAATQAAFEGLLDQLGLPAGLSVLGTLDLVNRIRALQDALRDLDERQRDFGERAAWCQAYDEKLGHHLNCLGIACGQGQADGLVALAQAGQRIAEAERIQARRQQLQERLDEQELVWQKAREALQDAEATWRGLLSAWGVESLQAAQQVLADEAERSRLEAIRESLIRALALQLGTGARGEALRVRLAAGVDPLDMARRVADLRLQETEHERQRDDLLKAQGNVARERQELLGATDVNALGQIAEGLQAEQAAQVRQYQVLTLAQALLEQTRQRYEQERQPAVLAHAGRSLAIATVGRYPRLHQSEDKLWVVDAAQGRRLAEHLSRGTAELLYICLRLGLITESALTVPLPVIMDDVLVNVDDARAEELARAIADFSRTHQVLYFTCHPRTAEMLTQANPSAMLIPMERYGGAAVPGPSL
jgi:uncharacterized protein YhaN